MLLRIRLLTLFVLLITLLLNLFAGISESHAKECVKSESASEGPFYIDSENRKIIYKNGEGAPIIFKIRVVDESCKPIKGAVVSVWHASSKGEYSKAGGTGAMDYRGYRVGGSKGEVEFKSLFPGWYPGRAAHIHVKVNKDGVNLLNTQLYFKQSLVNSVYKKKPYLERGLEDTPRSRDGLFLLLKNKDKHIFSSRISDGVIVSSADIVVSRK
ncbi:MAG: hypothetical protein ACKOW9_06480 [Candidatus Paceibacterota bacterium]